MPFFSPLGRDCNGNDILRQIVTRPAALGTQIVVNVALYNDWGIIRLSVKQKAPRWV